MFLGLDSLPAMFSIYSFSRTRNWWCNLQLIDLYVTPPTNLYHLEQNISQETFRWFVGITERPLSYRLAFILCPQVIQILTGKCSSYVLPINHCINNCTSQHRWALATFLINPVQGGRHSLQGGCLIRILQYKKTDLSKPNAVARRHCNRLFGGDALHCWGSLPFT